MFLIEETLVDKNELFIVFYTVHESLLQLAKHLVVLDYFADFILLPPCTAHFYLLISHKFVLINFPEARHWELVADFDFNGLGSLFKRESGLIMQGVLLGDPREVDILLINRIRDDIVLRVENGNLHLLSVPLQPEINLTNAQLSELGNIFNRDNGLHGCNITNSGGSISHKKDLLQVFHLRTLYRRFHRYFLIINCT